MIYKDIMSLPLEAQGCSMMGIEDQLWKEALLDLEERMRHAPGSASIGVVVPDPFATPPAGEESNLPPP
jgi:hypothetical protein